MLLRDSEKLRITTYRFDRTLGRCDRGFCFRDLCFQFLESLRRFLVRRLVAGVRLDCRAERGLLLRKFFLKRRKPRNRFVIVHDATNNSVDPTEFLHRLISIGLHIDEMPIAVDDHAELRAPIAEMIVRDYFVPDETENSGKSVANDRRANMADVHRLGDIRRRIVNDNRFRVFFERDAKALVISSLCDLMFQPFIS